MNVNITFDRISRGETGGRRVRKRNCRSLGWVKEPDVILGPSVLSTALLFLQASMERRERERRRAGREAFGL